MPRLFSISAYRAASESESFPFPFTQWGGFRLGIASSFRILGIWHTAKAGIKCGKDMATCLHIRLGKPFRFTMSTSTNDKGKLLLARGLARVGEFRSDF